MTRPNLLALLLVSACACAGHTPVPGSPGADAAGDTFLVVRAGAGDDGKAVTGWLVPDDGPAGYRVLAERPGLAFAAGEHVWAWRTRKLKANQCDCECFENAGGDEVGAGSPATAVCERPVEVTQDELVDLTGSAGPYVLPDGTPRALDSRCDGGEEGSGMAESTCHASLLGSVGPYLFVFDACYEYACGAAHGQLGAGFALVDLRDRRVVPLLSAAEQDAFARQGLPGALAAFRADADEEGAGDDAPAEVPESAELTLELPSFAAGGALAVELQFTADASYAESDGLWHSYSRSVRVPAPGLPTLLQPYATTPPVVARWMAAQGAGAQLGWSRVDGAPGARTRALAAFRAAPAQAR